MSEPRLCHFLSDMLLVLGLALFGLSLFQPIVTVIDVTPPSAYDFDVSIVPFLRADFYSYKINYYFEWIEVYSESLNAYWFSHEYLDYSYIYFNSFILIATFASQISTFLLALATFPLKTRVRALTLVPMIATTLWATLFYISSGTYSEFWKWDLTLGYWLTYPSAICVSLSIILPRERTTTPNLPTTTRE